MRSYFRTALRLSALIAFSTLAASQASAQDTQDTKIPTLTRENPAPSAEPTVKLRPVAPDPSVVIQAGVVAGTARIVPPAPRIVARAAGSVPVKGLATSSYRTQTAASVSPLKVNSNFGMRRGRRHTGIDFDGDWGETVGAPMSGAVAFAGVKRGYGNLIILDHGNGVSTYYAHLSSMYVAAGQRVESGQIIGAIGSTGRSSGPHLHYEVRVYGHPINPSSLISFNDGVALVDGRPLAGESEPDAGEHAEEQQSEAEEARPRRVAAPQAAAPQPAAPKPVVAMPGVIYVGESKMSVN